MAPRAELEIMRGVATITFTRDEKRNAFDAPMAYAVIEMLDEAEKQAARVVLLRAQKGASVWCAGHDLSEFQQGEDPCDPAAPMFQLFEKVKKVPMPVIAVLEGNAYAGGVLLLMAADLVVATDRVQLVMTGNRLGVPFPTEMYIYWLHIFGLHRMKEFFFTAKPMTAEDAHTAGIINRVCRPEELEVTLAELVEAIKACSPEGITDTKRQLNAIATASALSASERETIDAARRAIYSGDDFGRRLEGYRKSLEK